MHNIKAFVVITFCISKFEQDSVCNQMRNIKVPVVITFLSLKD